MSFNLPKILILTLDYPPTTGGVGEYVRGLVSHYPIKKIVVLKQGKDKKDYHQDGRRIIQRNFFNRFIWPKWLKTVFLVYQQLKNEKFDIIITPNVLPLGTVLFFVKLITKIPYCVSLHGLDIGLAGKNWWKRKLTKVILRQALGIIVNSRYTKNLILNFLSNNHPPIHILYPCLTKFPKTQADKKLLRQHYDFNPDQIILLSVGRLIRRKGFHLVIKALPAVLKKFPNISYAIIGNGPEYDYLQKLIKTSGLEKLIKIVTSANEDVLDDYYNLADIFLMPSLALGPDVEGFGLVYLEAGSRGLPVIGTNSGGIPEAVSDNKSGYLIEPGSESALESALSKLIHDPDLRRRLGEYGRFRAQEIFNWKNEIEKFILWLNQYER